MRSFLFLLVIFFVSKEEPRSTRSDALPCGAHSLPQFRLAATAAHSRQRLFNLSKKQFLLSRRALAILRQPSKVKNCHAKRFEAKRRDTVVLYRFFIAATASHHHRLRRECGGRQSANGLSSVLAKTAHTHTKKKSSFDVDRKSYRTVSVCEFSRVHKQNAIIWPFKRASAQVASTCAYACEEAGVQCTWLTRRTNYHFHYNNIIIVIIIINIINIENVLFSLSRRHKNVSSRVLSLALSLPVSCFGPQLPATLSVRELSSAALPFRLDLVFPLRRALCE